MSDAALRARKAADDLLTNSVNPTPRIGPLPDAPPFPLDALPEELRAYVSAAAESLGVPPEMVAVPMLGLAGGLIGNRLNLVLKHSWREYASFYIAVVAPPGAAKTPALNLAKWPLDAMQERARRDHVERVVQYADDLDAWKGQDPDKRGAKPTMPRQRQFFSTDLTIEALVAMLAHEPGIAIIRDEIGGWVAAMDQYRGGKGSDRQQFLSLWSGGTIKADRKLGETAYARHPVVCVVGGIQPDLASDLHHAAQKRDGFVERVLPVVPEVGIARWSESTPSKDQFTAVLELFRSLDRLCPSDTEDETAPAGIGVHLHPEAKKLWVTWHNDNADLIGAAHGLAAGFYSKLPAHVARVALVLHALWHPDDPSIMVSRDRMADAIEIGEFFRAHIGRFLALLHASAPVGTAGLGVRILRIVRNANGAWVTRSDIYRSLRNVTPDALTTALDDLIASGQIEHRMVATATKPADEYRIRISHYSHFSTLEDLEPGESANSANSANGYHHEQWDAEYEEVLV